MTNQYILGDQNLVNEIQDNFIDLICIDPPYEINYQNLEWDNKSLNWGIILKEFFRILKPSGNLIIFQGWSNVCDLIKISKGDWFLQNWIIWDRIKGRGAKYNFTSTREDILWFTKSNEFTFNKIYSNIKKKTGGMGDKNGQPNRSLSNVWTDISPIVPWSLEYNGYPAQKPLGLIKRIVTIFSNENNIVLDCFCGSGTTGLACRSLNRNFICIDNNIEAIELSKRRNF